MITMQRNLQQKKRICAWIEKAMNEKYGEGTVKLEIKEQYRNMAEKIRPCYHLIENAEEAARRAGIEPIVLPIRGGTDGARLKLHGSAVPEHRNRRICMPWTV